MKETRLVPLAAIALSFFVVMLARALSLWPAFLSLPLTVASLATVALALALAPRLKALKAPRLQVSRVNRHTPPRRQAGSSPAHSRAAGFWYDGQNRTTSVACNRDQTR